MLPKPIIRGKGHKNALLTEARRLSAELGAGDCRRGAPLNIRRSSLRGTGWCAWQKLHLLPFGPEPCRRCLARSLPVIAGAFLNTKSGAAPQRRPG